MDIGEFLPIYHSAIFAVKLKHTADEHKYTPRLLMLQRIGIRDEKPYSEVHIKGRSQTCQEKDARVVQNQFLFPHFYPNKLKYTSWQIAVINAFFKTPPPPKNTNLTPDTFNLLL